jgi:hypothetical protein
MSIYPMDKMAHFKSQESYKWKEIETHGSPHGKANYGHLNLYKIVHVCLLELGLLSPIVRFWVN